MLKRVVLSLALVSGFAQAGDPLDLVGDRCAPGDVIFYGEVAKDHMNALVCQNGQDVILEVRNTLTNKTHFVEAKTSQVEQVIVEDNTQSSDHLIIHDGNDTYQIGHLTLFASNVDENYLSLYGNGTEVKRFKFDDLNSIDGIRSSYVKDTGYTKH